MSEQNLLLGNLLKKYPAVHLNPKWRDPEHSLIGFCIYTQCTRSLLLQQGRANIPRLTTPKCLVYKPKSEFYLCIMLDFKTITPSNVFFPPKLLLCRLNLNCMLI